MIKLDENRAKSRKSRAVKIFARSYHFHFGFWFLFSLLGSRYKQTLTLTYSKKNTFNFKKFGQSSQI